MLFCGSRDVAGSVSNLLGALLLVVSPSWISSSSSPGQGKAKLNQPKCCTIDLSLLACFIKHRQRPNTKASKTIYEFDDSSIFIESFALTRLLTGTNKRLLHKKSN